MQFHIDGWVIFGLVTTIMAGIAHGTIAISADMIPEPWLSRTKAWTGFFSTINLAIMTAVQGTTVQSAAPPAKVATRAILQLTGALVVMLVIMMPGSSWAAQAVAAKHRAALPAAIGRVAHLSPSAMGAISLPVICDPLKLLPGCRVPSLSSASVASTSTIGDLWKAIIGAAIPDLQYAMALAKAVGTQGGNYRAACYTAILAANMQANGSGTTMTEPAEPRIFTDAEQLAEITDNLAINGPIFAACAAAANAVGTNVLTFVATMAGIVAK